MREIRLRYQKVDYAKYIGHLDVNRLFSRAISRSGIKIWFKEGFNPRPYMSFSLPIPLGVESYCEFLNIRLLDEISNDEVIKRINKFLPDGIKILEAYDDYQDSKVIGFSKYSYYINFNNNELALKSIIETLDKEEIIVRKKGKQGKRKVFKEVDIKNKIVDYNVSIRDDQVIINTILKAGNNDNLNPVLLFNTIIENIQMDYEWRTISKIALLDQNYNDYK